MPCSDGGPIGPTYIDNPETKRRLDRATRLLCYVMHSLRQTEKTALFDHNPDLQKWCDAHEAEDAKRVAAEKRAADREAAKKSALAKLSPAERKALGFL